KLIVCLGRIAAAAVIKPDFKITREHGVWFDLDGARAMAMFHPAALLRDETKPVILGCITTIGSFVGIMFVHTDLLRDFGLFAAFAITGTMFFCLALLPAMLPAKAKGIPASIDKVSTYPADRNKAALAVIGLLTLAALGAFCIGGVNFDANMHNLGYDSENVLHSEKLLESKTYTGDKEKYFASSGKTMEEAIANFGVLAEKLDSLQSIGLVKGYSHTNDILVPISVQQDRIDAWKGYWTKERLAKVQQLINATAPGAGLVSDGFEAFFELAEADFQPDTLYKAGLIPDGYLSTLMERSYGGDYLCFTNVRCKEEAQDADSTDYNRICQAIATQPNMMVLDTYFYTRDTLKQLNEDFNALQWVSLLFVLIVLFVSFGFNVKHSLLGFMPILLSWIIVLGAMFIFGKGFNLINIVISTFIFGIGVDYSIFVMNGLVSPEGNKLQYHRTAILLSAVILIISVGSMVIAKHPAIQSVGFSTLVGLVSAVVLAWVVQPAIYRLTNRKK
ncbi:MAG: MMPL family transporter, partial [Bacteroidaceae bacterium]|nr:MMPL family transporter [Bacteroidaceae bacterium]